VTEPAVDPVVQTGDTPPPTYEELQALNRQQLHEQFGVPLKGSKDDLVDAVLDKFGVAKPKGNETILAVAWPVDAHNHGDHVISQSGTAVPSRDADDIITQAASQGVTIREVR
jgi:hypothetical protein